ncbi:hypothetical protein Salat_1166000, partial [Sesamum alatum]
VRLAQGSGGPSETGQVGKECGPAHFGLDSAKRVQEAGRLGHTGGLTHIGPLPRFVTRVKGTSRAQVFQFEDIIHIAEASFSESQSPWSEHCVFVIPEPTLPLIQKSGDREEGGCTKANDEVDHDEEGTTDFADSDRGKLLFAEISPVSSHVISVGHEPSVGKGELAG